MLFEHEVLIRSLWLMVAVILLLFAAGVCLWCVVLVDLCCFGLVVVVGCRWWFCDGVVCCLVW